jgi:hypothetical protein
MIIFLLFLIFAPAQAQNTAEVEVPILDKVSSRCWTRALKDFGPVVDEATFLELTSDESPHSARHDYERCGTLKRLKVDFSKQTLLRYRVSGDCFVRGRATVTRNDTTRTYTLNVTRIYGGCRAAGSFEGWLVVDKFLPDYKVETVVHEVDKSAEPRMTEDW